MHCTGDWVGLEADQDGTANLSPAFDSRTVQPVSSRLRCSDRHVVA